MVDAATLLAAPLGALLGLATGKLAAWEGRPRPLGSVGPRLAFALMGAAVVTLALAAATVMDALFTPGVIGGPLPAWTFVATALACSGALVLLAPERARQRLAFAMAGVALGVALVVGAAVAFIDRLMGCFLCF